MNGAKKPFRVLLSPLDWGLGHATRCIPLVRELIQQGCEVVLACSGQTEALLAAEFPGIAIRKIDGYHISYSKNHSLFISMLLQLPGIVQSIKKEQRWLASLLQKEHFDLVISDNRPGLHNKKVKCIYITHQLYIHSGKGKWVSNLLQKLHSSYIKNFEEVWVPDTEGNPNLAGELSHPATQLIQPKYLGLLSRLAPQSSTTTEYDLLVLLSGPEPQRSLLEEKLYIQLVQFKGRVVLARGLPQQTATTLESHPHITVYNHLPAQALQQIIAATKLVICRSGYTTLMDLIRLQQKALLIPTPGQPEQEYLAQYMQQQSLFPFLAQKDADLQTALEKAANFPFRNYFSEIDFYQYKTVITETVANLNK